MIWGIVLPTVVPSCARLCCLNALAERTPGGAEAAEGEGEVEPKGQRETAMAPIGLSPNSLSEVTKRNDLELT
eukprot:6204016-Pleurochrysis_carterae.AAC.2